MVDHKIKKNNEALIQQNAAQNDFNSKLQSTIQTKYYSEFLGLFPSLTFNFLRKNVVIYLDKITKSAVYNTFIIFIV